MFSPQADVWLKDPTIWSVNKFIVAPSQAKLIIHRNFLSKNDYARGSGGCWIISWMGNGRHGEIYLKGGLCVGSTRFHPTKIERKQKLQEKNSKISNRMFEQGKSQLLFFLHQLIFAIFSFQWFHKVFTCSVNFESLDNKIFTSLTSFLSFLISLTKKTLNYNLNNSSQFH